MRTQPCMHRQTCASLTSAPAPAADDVTARLPRRHRCDCGCCHGCCCPSCCCCRCRQASRCRGAAAATAATGACRRPTGCAAAGPAALCREEERNEQAGRVHRAAGVQRQSSTGAPAAHLFCCRACICSRCTLLTNAGGPSGASCRRGEVGLCSLRACGGPDGVARYVHCKCTYKGVVERGDAGATRDSSSCKVGHNETSATAQ